MKKIFVFSLLLILTSSNIFSQSGWFWISSKNTFPSSGCNSIYFTTAQIGYICGTNGKMDKTIDGGLNWFESSNGIPSNEYLEGLYFPSANTGYVGGGGYLDARIYKTTNGGLNWTYTNAYNTSRMERTFFLNDNTGYVSGGIKIYRTTNGGINWINAGGPFICSSIFFVNEMTGYYVSGYYGEILKTTNGGQSWDIKLTSNQYSMNGLYFLNENTGYCVGGHYLKTCIRKTTDGGNSWNTMLFSTGNTTKYLESVQFINENTGYSVGICGAMFYTTNSGKNWQEYFNFTDLDYKCIAFSGSTGYAVSEGYSGSPGIIKTYNSNNEWFLMSHGILTDIKSICQSNSFTFYAVGDKGKILKSTNSGSNWKISPSFTKTKINSVCFIDTLTGFCVGEKGLLLKTSDGKNWNNTYLSDNNLNFIFSKSDRNLYVTGQNGYFYKSTDLGKNWITINTGTENDLFAGNFITNNSGILVGENGTILKSINGGINWVSINSSTNNQLNSIYFIDSVIGYCVGKNSTILKSTNSGENWFQIVNNFNKSFNAVYFVNNVIGYIVGDSAVVLSTTDGGNTWTNQTSPASYKFNSVYFVNSNTGIIVGSDNLILKTTTGGGTLVEINSNYSNLPHSFSLHQNYPNPFNPVTKIKFEIPLLRGVSEVQGVSTKIIIYDLLGRVITTLVNEQLKPGSYEVEWDGSGYASGVYFYALIAEDPSTSLRVTETKRMVLVK